MSEVPSKTPTEDLLRNVPRDHRIVVEDDSSAHFIPIGRLSHEAANEIAALRAENERLRKREATLFEMVKRCERDAQRTLRDANNQGHVCGYRTACEAIQQRAAGLGEPKEE